MILDKEFQFAFLRISMKGLPDTIEGNNLIMRCNVEKKVDGRLRIAYWLLGCLCRWIGWHYAPEMKDLTLQGQKWYDQPITTIYSKR